MANIYRMLVSLLPEQDQRNIGQVVSYGGGYTQLQTLGGGTVKVLGEGVPVGSMAFFKGGRLEEAAPNLPSYEIEV